LSALAKVVQHGHRAVGAFVIQRPDARAFSPNYDADPAFCRALTEAIQAGVEAYAFRCRVSRREIEVAGAVPVPL
jgi:sugar fermentation stimulation protein A